jgi:hypothetical protein
MVGHHGKSRTFKVATQALDAINDAEIFFFRGGISLFRWLQDVRKITDDALVLSIFWVSTAPMPLSLASHCKVKGCSKSEHDRIGALISAFFTSAKARSLSSNQAKRVFFLVRLIKGATIVEKLGTNRRYQLIIPVSRRKSRTPRGRGISTTTLDLQGVDVEALTVHHITEVAELWLTELALTFSQGQSHL